MGRAVLGGATVGWRPVGTTLMDARGTSDDQNDAWFVGGLAVAGSPV
jgi:hypothetical protein